MQQYRQRWSSKASIGKRYVGVKKIGRKVWSFWSNLLKPVTYQWPRCHQKYPNHLLQVRLEKYAYKSIYIYMLLFPRYLSLYYRQINISYKQRSWKTCHKLRSHYVHGLALDQLQGMDSLFAALHRAKVDWPWTDFQGVLKLICRGNIDLTRSGQNAAMHNTFGIHNAFIRFLSKVVLWLVQPVQETLKFLYPQLMWMFDDQTWYFWCTNPWLLVQYILISLEMSASLGICQIKWKYIACSQTKLLNDARQGLYLDPCPIWIRHYAILLCWS